MRRERTISGSREYERVFTQGRRTRRGPLTVYVVPGKSTEDPSRLGLAVRLPGAVRRNRARRRLREAWRKACPETGLDVVIRAGESVEGADFQELVNHVKAACKKLEVAS